MSHMYGMKIEDLQKKYDTILFPNHNSAYPEFDRKYTETVEAGVGMVFLQFTWSSHPQWDGFHDMMGRKWFLPSFTEDKSYFPDLALKVQMMDKAHPVVQGLEGFSLRDAYYGDIFIDPATKPLLTITVRRLCPQWPGNICTRAPR